MEIKAVKFRKEGFYTQPFVMGGEECPDKFDRNIPTAAACRTTLSTQAAR